MMTFTSFLTDIDDTLIKSGKIYDKALRFASRFLSEKFSLDDEAFFKTAEEQHFIVSRNFPTVHTRHSRILVFRRALDIYVKKYDFSLLSDAEDVYWDYFIKNIELYPHVLETLKKIKEAGVKTAIVSDGDLSLRIRKAKVSGILDYMDDVVASEEVIFEKPFSAIFTLALSRLGSKPEDALMYGNDYKNDIRGAQLVGIKAALFNPPVDANLLRKEDGIVPDYEVKDIEELVGILGL